MQLSYGDGAFIRLPSYLMTILFYLNDQRTVPFSGSVEPTGEIDAVVEPWQDDVDGRQDDEECAFDATGQMRSHCDADHDNDTFARTRERSIQTLLPKMQKIIHLHFILRSVVLSVLRTLKCDSYLTTQVCSSHKYDGEDDKETSPSKFSIYAGAPLLYSTRNFLREERGKKTQP